MTVPKGVAYKKYYQKEDEKKEIKKKNKDKTDIIEDIHKKEIDINVLN